MQNKSRELEVAIQVALVAGKVLEKYFETELEHLTKEYRTIVTVADRESEEVIKKIILSEFPEHSIFGEETGHTKNKSNFTWHIDPVDGTRNFANGIPLFAVSIALEENGEVIVGVIYSPEIKNALFYAEKGKGAYQNGKKIFVSKDNEKKGIVTVASFIQEENVKLMRALRNSLPGIVVGTTQIGFSTYDFAAGTLLVQEAGGKITNLEGKPWKFPENYFIASNGVFHDLLVEEVQKQIKKVWPK